MSRNPPGWPDYDVEEMNVLARMKRIMKEKHGYEDEDFEDATFTDIESMFLDDCGEEDFRPAIDDWREEET